MPLVYGLSLEMRNPRSVTTRQVRDKISFSCKKLRSVQTVKRKTSEHELFCLMGCELQRVLDQDRRNLGFGYELWAV